MNAPIDSHTPTAPAADVVPDYGAMNRELLAEKLAAAYWNGPVDLRDKPSGVITSWLAAADVAITELQGTS